MKKLAVTLSKGGVAKSSTSIALAHGLSMKGKKVLLIDTDDQGQDAFLLGIKPAFGLAEVLNEEKTIEEAIVEARPNLWVLAGGKSLAGAKRAIGRKDFGAEQTLSEVLKPIEGKFDFVIVDTSPSWDALTINALFYADEVITPVNSEVLTLQSVAEFNNRLRDVQRFNNKLSHRYVLPTFHDGRVKKSSEILTQLKKHFGEKVCDPIRYNVKLSECSGFGKTIFEFAPSSHGAKDYEKFVTRILKDEQTTNA